jgi:hypothetical protein
MLQGFVSSFFCRMATFRTCLKTRNSLVNGGGLDLSSPDQPEFGIYPPSLCQTSLDVVLHSLRCDLRESHGPENRA